MTKKTIGISKMRQWTDFLVMATTAPTMVAHCAGMYESIATALENGWTSDVVIIAHGRWPKKRRKNLRKLLNLRKHGFLYSHVVFPIDDEEIKNPDLQFHRVLRSFNVTHFVDTNKQNIARVAHLPSMAKVALFHLSEKKTWKDADRWLIRTHSQYLPLLPQGDDARKIIQTGVKKR